MKRAFLFYPILSGSSWTEKMDEINRPIISDKALSLTDFRDIFIYWTCCKIKRSCWKTRDPGSSFSRPLTMNVATTILGCGEKCKEKRAEPAVASDYGLKKDSSKWTGKPCSQPTMMCLNPAVALYWHGGRGDPPLCLQVVTWKRDLLRLKPSQ